MRSLNNPRVLSATWRRSRQHLAVLAKNETHAPAPPHLQASQPHAPQLALPDELLEPDLDASLLQLRLQRFDPAHPSQLVLKVVVELERKKELAEGGEGFKVERVDETTADVVDSVRSGRFVLLLLKLGGIATVLPNRRRRALIRRRAHRARKVTVAVVAVLGPDLIAVLDPKRCNLSVEEIQRVGILVCGPPELKLLKRDKAREHVGRENMTVVEDARGEVRDLGSEEDEIADIDSSVSRAGDLKGVEIGGEVTASEGDNKDVRRVVALMKEVLGGGDDNVTKVRSAKMWKGLDVDVGAGKLEAGKDESGEGVSDWRVSQ